MSMLCNSKYPLISIITPSYNCGKYIEDTILSIKEQTYANIEHIIVDGGSNDCTINILKRYEDSIRWISEPDNGMYDAINKGFAIARGEIFTYINADDLYYSNEVIKSVVDTFVNDPAFDFVYGHCAFMNDEGHVLYIYNSPLFYRALFLAYSRILFHQPTCFWRRRVHVKFDDSLKYCGDSRFFKLLCKQHNGKNSNVVIAKFRVRTDNIALLNREKMSREDEVVFGKQSEKQVSIIMKIIDIIYIRTYLNLTANIKRFLLYCRGIPYL